MEKPTGDHNETEFINPTRPQYVDPISITLPQPVETTTINHKPFVTKRLEKIALTAGKASRIIIPADTFQDLEDGDARDLVRLEKPPGLSFQQILSKTWRMETRGTSC